MSDKTAQVKSDKPKTKTKSYVILNTASHWEVTDIPGIEFTLSRVRKESSHYAKFHKTLNAELKQRIIRAVDLGLLSFTDNPEEFQINVQDTRPVNRKTPRYRTKELDHPEVKANRRMPRAPQVTHNNMEAENVSPEAAKFIKLQAHQIVDRLGGRLANMEKEKAISFLSDLKALEQRGMNPSFGPRRMVVDTIDEFLVQMGVKPGMITGIQVTEDKEADDKVTRIAL